MLARQVTTRASRALLARSLHPQGPVAYFSRQRGPYDDDAPAGDFRIGTVEVKPEAENAGFSTAHRFSVGAATMPLSPQNEAPSATGYAAQSAPTEETEAPVIPKHLQKESARPCADSLLVEEKLRSSLAKSRGIMGEVVDQLPKVQIKKGYAADPAPDATTMFNFGTDYTRGLASNRSGARSTESEKTSYTKAVADRDRDEDTLSILRTSMATDGTRQVKTASYTLDSSAYNFSKARRSGKLSADDRFRAAHDYLERKRVMDTAKPEADASAAGAAGSNAQPSTPPGEPEETPKKKKSGGWINSFFG